MNENCFLLFSHSSFKCMLIAMGPYVLIPELEERLGHHFPAGPVSAREYSSHPSTSALVPTLPLTTDVFCWYCAPHLLSIRAFNNYMLRTRISVSIRNQLCRSPSNPVMTVMSPIGNWDPRICCHGNHYTFPASIWLTSHLNLWVVMSQPKLCLTLSSSLFPLFISIAPFLPAPTINLSHVELPWPGVVCPDTSQDSNTILMLFGTNTKCCGNISVLCQILLLFLQIHQARCHVRKVMEHKRGWRGMTLSSWKGFNSISVPSLEMLRVALGYS